MKCLIITGSPSKKYPWDGKLIDGFTGQLVAEVQAEMQRLGEVSFEEIRLSDINLSYCKGCYNCFSQGEVYCPHSAQFQPVMQRIRDADCLILTSPVYALNVSALVKGFFDLGAYNHHRPCFYTKKALVVSSTAGGYAKKVCGYMRDELLHWGFNRVYTLPVIRMGAAELTPKMKANCHKAARRLYNDTTSGKLHSPALKQVFFYQLWRNMSKADKTTADYTYWHESDLGKHEFAPVVRLGVGKWVFGKMINGLFGQIVKNNEYTRRIMQGNLRYGGTVMTVIGINGSPRKGWNTHTLIERVLEGAASKGAQTELVHLYDLDYKGCVSCLACKRKGAKAGCALNDGLSEILAKISACDALVIGTPIYLGDITGMTRAFIERLLFPYISYQNDMTPKFERHIKSVMIYTMNAPEAALEQIGYTAKFSGSEQFMAHILGSSQTLVSTETLQVDDYSRYDMTLFDADARKTRRKTEFPEDCKRAFEIGVTLVSD